MQLLLNMYVLDYVNMLTLDVPSQYLGHPNSEVDRITPRLLKLVRNMAHHSQYL